MKTIPLIFKSFITSLLLLSLVLTVNANSNINPSKFSILKKIFTDFKSILANDLSKSGFEKDLLFLDEIFSPLRLTVVEDCSDGIDNDGLTDSADPDYEEEVPMGITLNMPTISCPDGDVGVITSSETPSSGDCNLLSNHEFDQGMQDWNAFGFGGSSGNFYVDNSGQLSGSNAFYADINSASGNFYEIQLVQDDLTFETGKTYSLSFVARAQANRNITVTVQLGNSPFTTYFSQTIALTSSAQTYTFNNITTSTNLNGNAILVFNLAASATNLWIDDVDLKDNSCVPSGGGANSNNLFYRWMSRQDNGNGGYTPWNLIAGETDASYDPPAISVTTQYIRQSSLNQIDWLDSEILTVQACSPPFICDSKFYQSIEVNGSYFLYEIETNPVVITPLVNLTNTGVQGSINSAVFNPVDGYIYVLQVSNPYNLYRIYGDFTTELVGSVSGFDNGDFINAGGIYPDGIIIYRGANSADFYELNMNTLSVNKICNYPTVNGSANNIGDIAYNPQNGFFYGTRDNTNTLVELDLDNCTETEINLSRTVQNANGAFYINAAGLAYGYENSTGKFTRIDLTTGLIEDIGQNAATSQVDGCSCEGIKFIKEVSADFIPAGAAATYTFKIHNNWVQDLTNIAFRDTLREGLTWASEPFNLTGGLTIGSTAINGNTIGDFTLTNVPIGVSTFQISFQSPAPYSGPNPYLNQAFLKDLPTLLGGSEPSDYPVSPELDDPTPILIDCLPNLDFSQDANGNPLPSGTIIDEQFASWGLHITSDNQGSHATMIFDSEAITGGDTDLGTPNQNFGGPGIGTGGQAGKIGENNQALGNSLILANSNNAPANDFSGGGEFTFSFDTPMDISYLEIVDIDYGEIENRVRLYDSSNNLLLEKRIIAYGNNSYQVVVLGTADVSKMVIEIEGSGSIQTLNFCDAPPASATVGDYVWNDVNQDGVQDNPSEAAIPNIVLELRDNSNNLLATETTDSQGFYEFPDIMPGSYIIVVQNITVPSLYENTFDLDGDDDGHSGIFTLAPNENKDNVDFGYALNCNMPQVNNDNIQTCPTDSYAGDVSTNDSNNANAVYEIVDNPTNGTVTMNQNGGFTYTPTVSFATGNDSFSYRAYNNAEVCSQEGSVLLSFSCGLSGCATPSVNFTGDIEICAASSTTITAVGAESGYSYQWSNGLGTGSSKTITPPSSSTQNVTTTYSVTVTSSQGCSVVETLDITTESLPSATILSSDDHCGDDNGTITFSFLDHPNRTQLQFSLDGGTTYSSNVADNSGSITYSNLSAGSYDLWVRWGDSDCPFNLPDVTIVNTGGLSVNITGPSSICEGEPAQIIAQATGGTFPYFYTWDNGLGSGSIKTIYPNSTTTYSVTATDNYGCTATDQIEVIVLPNTDPACSDCLDPADDDGDGVCRSEDCDDNNPNVPAAIGMACDDGNSYSINDVIQVDKCTCIGQFVPCSINFEVQIDQPIYDNNGTNNNLSDDTFTFSVLITGNGSTWTANGQTGAYGTMATFGPFPVDAAGITFDIVDADNPRCQENISVNISSCIYSGACICCE